jgi:hypothetical protein
VEKFLGNYLLWTPVLPQSALYPGLGLVLIAVVVGSAWLRRGELDWAFFCLVACLAVTTALSVIRVSAELMHPVLAGGRYFFLPYVLLSWLLLYLCNRRYQGTTVLCVAALLLSVRMAIVFGPRTHRAIDWRAEVNQCLESPSHTFPIHYEGDATHIMWSVHVSGDACRRLVESSVFDNRIGATGAGH